MKEETTSEKGNKNKGACFSMIRRLSVAFGHKPKHDPNSEENLAQDSGHTLKIHRLSHGTDSNVDMTEEAVRKTLKKQELIQNHKEKEQALAEIKMKLSTLDGILHQLNEDYVLSDTICFCLREVELQEMITEAINSYERKVVYNIGGSEGGQGDTEPLISPLLQLAQDTKSIYQKRQDEVARDRHYAKMSVEELVRELVCQEENLARYGMQYRELEMRIEKMSKDYVLACQQFIWKRYNMLIQIIEEATMDCLPLR